MKIKYLIAALCITFVIASTLVGYKVYSIAYDRLQYKSNLFIIIGKDTPRKIVVYNNCLSGKNLSFKKGIAALRVATKNIFIFNRLDNVNIVVVNEESSNDIKMYNKDLLKIVSHDSTSSCGLYKEIYLK